MNSDQTTATTVSIVEHALTKRERKANTRQALRAAKQVDQQKKSELALVKQQGKSFLAQEKQQKKVAKTKKKAARVKQQQDWQQLVQTNKLPETNQLQTTPDTAFYPLFISEAGEAVTTRYHQLELRPNVEMVPSLLMGSVTFSFIGGMMGSFVDPAMGVAGLVAGPIITGLLMTTFITVPAKLYDSVTIALYKNMEQESTKLFQIWLIERYNIHISSKTARKFRPSFMIGEIRSSVPLVDAQTGNVYFLTPDVDNYGFKVTTDKAGMQEAPTVNGHTPISAIEPVLELTEQRKEPSTVEVVLSGVDEVSSETYQRINSNLAKLRKYELDVETAHAVERIQLSLSDALTVYEKLVELNPEQDNTSTLSVLLNALEAETKTLIQQQVEEAQRQLQIETHYTLERTTS